jgi:hypothetical protein
MSVNLLWWCATVMALGMAFQLRKAKRSTTKLRLLLSGPSGSGKTWGALTIAKGLGGNTVVIDTEEGSSDLYDHLLDFQVIDLKPPFTPERYIEAIRTAEDAGAEVIIVDSVTHCWSGAGGCLELLEDIAKAQFKGNTWSAFSVITPRWRKFVDAVLRSPCHVICTGRSKTETAQSTDTNGRKKVEKLGMRLEARDGLEYEFTVCLDIVHDGHYATTSKDRTGLFAGDPRPITVDTGRRIAEWLATAEPVAPPSPPPARVGWMDRVRSATTQDELDAIWQEALAAQHSGGLTIAQVDRLDTEIAKRGAALEVEAAK